MLSDFSFDNSKRVALLTLLLMQPMIVQAESARAAASSHAAVQPVGGIQQVQEAYPAQDAYPIQDKGATIATATAKDRQSYVFPRWPEKREIKRERIPPPPPGPYMSSALSGASFSGPAHMRDDTSSVKRAAMEPLGLPVKPMQKFSPDTPWPSSNMAHSPQRWKPENGYNFVNTAKNAPNPAMPPNYYHNRYPMMNWPGNANNMPFMGPSAGMNTGRTYPVRPPGSRGQNTQPQTPYRAPYSANSRP